MRTQRVQITVTADMIDKGVRAGCEDCPVALAINEQLEPLTLMPDWRGFSVSVLDDNIAIIRDGMGDRLKGCRQIPLPQSATEFIRKFDNRPAAEHPEPFSFELRLPVDCLRKGAGGAAD